jgi:tetratricopeptide (TPR) repeat protein
LTALEEKRREMPHCSPSRNRISSVKRTDLPNHREDPIRRLCFLTALAIIISSSTSAQAQQNGDPQFQIQVDVTGKVLKEKRKDQWGELRSKNFIVAGDADEKDLRAAASELELFRAEFAQMFSRANGTSSVATRVIIFRDRDALRLYRPSGNDTSTDAYLQAKSDLNYLVMSAGEKLSRDIMHDLARLLMRDSITPLPLWLETGITEYFSAYKLMRLGEDRIVKLGIDEYKGGFSEKNLMPLEILMKIDRESFEELNPELQTIYHTESTLLFHYLLQTRRINPALRMTNAMAEGMPLERAFRDIFKVPAATVLENLKNHIKMSKFGGWAITMEGLTVDPKKHVIRIIFGQGFMNVPVHFDTLRVEIEALPVRILSDADTNAYRGDLQLHNDRLPEAENLLRQSIRENPALAAPHASLGLALALQKKYADAYAEFDRARLLDSRGNALGYYYTAWTIREDARNAGTSVSVPQLDDMEAALSDAVDVDPAFVPAAELLAETQLLLHRNMGTASKLLVKALQQSLGRESILLLLARISSAGGDKATAGYMLQRVIASGGISTKLKGDARLLLAELNLTTEQKTAFSDFQVPDSTNGARGVDAKSLTKDGVKALAKNTETRIVRGYLTEVQCTKGLTIYIRVGVKDMDERIENLHTDSPGDVAWLTDTGEKVDAVKCEKRPGSPVAITYAPKRKGLMIGEPISVELCRGVSFDCDFRKPGNPSP